MTDLHFVTVSEEVINIIEDARRFAENFVFGINQQYSLHLWQIIV